MSYTLACPFCNARIEVPDELDNTTAACPSCGQEICLTRDDAVDDADPLIASMRQQAEDDNRRRMDQLRMMAMMREADARADKRTGNIVNVLLWIFVWGPLCVIAVSVVIRLLLRFAHG